MISFDVDAPKNLPIIFCWQINFPLIQFKFFFFFFFDLLFFEFWEQRTITNLTTWARDDLFECICTFQVRTRGKILLFYDARYNLKEKWTIKNYFYNNYNYYSEGSLNTDISVGNSIFEETYFFFI